MFRLTALALLLLASANAFQVSMPAFAPPRPALSTTVRHLIMSEAETDSILQSASECADGECSVDDVTELVSELKEQKKILEARLDQIMNMVADLQHVNEKESRKTDEVRALVKDMLRVFNTDKPRFSPTGFSGDVGKGSSTAYDSLAPKKWKSPDSKK